MMSPVNDYYEFLCCDLVFLIVHFLEGATATTYTSYPTSGTNDEKYIIISKMLHVHHITFTSVSIDPTFLVI